MVHVPQALEFNDIWCCVWPLPESTKRSWSKQKVCCTSTMIRQVTGTKLWKYVQWFRLIREHKVPAVIHNTCRKLSVFVTLIYNGVKVKLKGVLHIYNDCAIDWHQICANMWSGLGWVAAHKKYHPYSVRTDTHASTWIPMSHVQRFHPAGTKTYFTVVDSYGIVVLWH